MPFDSITLYSVVQELKEKILSGKIISIIQSSPFDFTMTIASHNGNHNLLISIHPSYARIHLTQTDPKRDKRWHFADFLQKHVQDGIIDSIQQVELDRIIKIRIIPQTEIMYPEPKLLIGEFMGKHSNAILVDEDSGKILESLKHIDETMSRYREILPGLEYKPPPPSGQSIDPFSVDKQTFLYILKDGSAKLRNKLLKNFKGISPSLAKEIIARSQDESPEAVWKSFNQIMAYIQKGKFKPTVVTNPQNDTDVMDVSALNLHQFPEMESIHFDSTGEALDFYYHKLSFKEAIQSEKSAILQAVKKRHEMLADKHKTLKEQLKKAKNAEEFKIKGELLTANLYKVERGQKEVTVQNFYDPEGKEVVIQLDEKISPSDNAQQLFEQYKKAKRSKSKLESLINKNKTEIRYISRAQEAVEQTEDMETLEKIRNGLAKEGIIRKKDDTKKKSKQEKAPLFRQFKSSQGFQIYVGRNDRENDLIVKGESTKHDMWLHAKQIEGSHVLIKNPEKKGDIPERTLLEAAIIAAQFSKAKHSTVVPVDYTWVKYVNKPRGAKPGFVTYTHEKTLFVSPADFNKLFQSE
ncbi:DUF814 domain-containing protein [Candidatus Poribacteria bacterium]|nr:DUF814 domain-containing protein [Candidatus Poribacteria bacterium]